MMIRATCKRCGTSIPYGVSYWVWYLLDGSQIAVCSPCRSAGK